ADKRGAGTIYSRGPSDPAVLSAATANLTETDAAADISTSGTLTISDVDSPATFLAQAGTAGSYGSFSISAAGAWTYTADTAHNEFAAGSTYTDTFAVAASDGHTTALTTLTTLTNHPPLLSAAPSTLPSTSSSTPPRPPAPPPLPSTPPFRSSDVDSPATFLAQAGTAGSYGSFSISAAGAWTYTADTAHNEFAAGSTYTDTFAVA